MLKKLQIKTIVVKIGTKVLTGNKYGLDRTIMKGLVSQISEIHKSGVSAVMVSSGAIGAGMGLLGLKQRPKKLSVLQACAAVGQPHLMKAYDDLFRERALLTAQVLLTQEDLNDRKRYLNARNTLLTLLDRKVVPIINENDTVSTEEIKFGDNDKLSSLVANLIGADLLVLLSDVEGLYKYEGAKRELISQVPNISDQIKSLAQKGKDELGTGGMVSKLQAASIAMHSGIACVFASGKSGRVLIDIVEGRQTGTYFSPAGGRLSSRKCWLLFSTRPKGGIKVDSGAKDALIKRHKSLLPSGIVEADGEFKKGDIISIVGPDNKEFGRGISNYSARDAARIRGLKTSEIAGALGRGGADEIVHKDNLVILG